MSNPFENLAIILKSEDLKDYAGKTAENLANAVMFHDVQAGLEVACNTVQLLWNTPNMIFWDKISRFLYGTFHSYEEQVKFASRFTDDNDQYNEFVKRVVQLVDKIENDKKIDYFAALTRAFLLECVDMQVYFKLSSFLTMCTSEELDFIKSKQMNEELKNSMMVSALYSYGLVTTSSTNHELDDSYIFSSFAIALKQNCLNFDEDLPNIPRIKSYSDMQPNTLAPKARLTWNEF